MTQESLSRMETAKQLLINALNSLVYRHRHKHPLGGCDECTTIMNMRAAIGEIEKAAVAN
jgi:hypothetical protein